MQGQDGSMYSVEAPEGATDAEILSRVQAEHSAPTTSAQAIGGARMSPQDEEMYRDLAADKRSTVASLRGFLKVRGFDFTDADAADFMAHRGNNVQVAGAIKYRAAPELPKAPPNTAYQNADAFASKTLDGFIPGLSHVASGMDGTIGNAWDAIRGKASLDPVGSFKAGMGPKPSVETFAQENPNAAAAAGWTGLAGSFLLPEAKVAKGGGLLAHVTNSAITGGGYGALSGFLNGTGDGRVANAENGALFGAGLGAVVAPASRYVGSTLSTARRNIPGLNTFLTGAENLPRRVFGLPLIHAEANAYAQAERVLAKDMATGTIDSVGGHGTVPASPATVASEVTRRHALNVPAMPADVSEKLRQTAAWALQGRGTMASRARQELMSRQAQAAPRVRQHIADELGAAVDPIEEAEAIHRRVSEASGPGYAAAYAQPMVITPEIQSIMRTPAFQDALPTAYRNIRNAERDPHALGFTLDASGNIIATDALSTEGFDQVIRSMRDSVSRDDQGEKARQSR